MIFHGLRVDETRTDAGTIYTLRNTGTMLGTVLESAADGVCSVSIIDGSRVYESLGSFLHVDDALMAVKIYHDVRKMAR